MARLRCDRARGIRRPPVSTLRLVHVQHVEPLPLATRHAAAERRSAIVLVLLGLVLLFIG
jgi:hypothetical protein